LSDSYWQAITIYTSSSASARPTPSSRNAFCCSA
jgi:hypothetical protein